MHIDLVLQLIFVNIRIFKNYYLLRIINITLSIAARENRHKKDLLLQVMLFWVVMLYSRSQYLFLIFEPTNKKGIPKQRRLMPAVQIGVHYESWDNLSLSTDCSFLFYIPYHSRGSFSDHELHRI